MGIAEAEAFFKQKGVKHDIIFFDESSATVALAAKALGIEEKYIAKTLAFDVKGQGIVIVVCGTARIDNKKFKQAFNTKAKMMSYEETLERTSHPVGGVCPFGVPKEISIYLDESLRAFEFVYPAAGGTHTAVKISVNELAELTGGTWIDVCKEENTAAD